MQKHAARRLHWDFRLEWEGTLRSWAVPKGPSLDPADKRLAVEVEDHPIAYAKFEGDIPKGQYGGGHVDIWDNGTWEPVGDFAKGLKKGHLEFELFGKKLSGRWHLVRTRMQGKQPNWLLMKSGDFAARAGADADVIDAGDADDPKRMLRPRGREAAMRRSPKPRWRAQAAQREDRVARAASALPASIKPMLATLVDKVPGDEGWVYELKYDGVRLLCRCDGDDVRCISRNGIDWTHKVGPVVEALAKLKLDGAWVDGELIVTDPNGRSDFSLLQHTMEQGRLDELQFCIFDLLYYRGEDLRALPLSERKVRLDAAFAKLPAKGPLRLADQIHSDSAELLARVCNQHLEGLVAKKIDSRLHRRPLQELAQGEVPSRAGVRGGRRRISARARHRHVFLAAGRREVRQGLEIRRPGGRRFRCARARRVARAHRRSSRRRTARSTIIPTSAPVKTGTG